MDNLAIGDQERAEAKQVIDYAMNHIYHYPSDLPEPGSIPDQIVRVGVYHCVFSFTSTDAGIYRHLTISMPDVGDIPADEVIVALADLFGFSGGKNELIENVSSGRWHVDADPVKLSVAVLEKVDNAKESQA